MSDSDKIEELRQAVANGAFKDPSFALSLCNQFARKDSLSDKQWFWVNKLLKEATGSSGAAKPTTSGVEEIFSGQILQSLLRDASKKLKRPKLRYQTDTGFKVIFSYVAERDSKWFDCIFIDNGQRAEAKKRYGFVANNGNGRLDRNAPPEIKALIRKIAEDPTNTAKLQGQAYKHCCFCGLELLNKSSVYHGYGPICAEKWGLPWGDTGDDADQEEAAAAELKHINLQELGD
jgi:hypothetical protein